MDTHRPRGTGRHERAQAIADDLRLRREELAADVAAAEAVPPGVIVVDFQERRPLHGLAALAALSRGAGEHLGD